MPRRFVRLALLVLVTASLVSGRSTVAAVDADSEHIVEPGETLSEISRAHSISLDQLIALNDLADPDALSVGQVLKLRALTSPSPDAPSPAREAAGVPPNEYVVRPGDTLSAIARAFGVSLRALIDANQLADPNQLYVGQHIALPASATPIRPSPSPSPSPVPPKPSSPIPASPTTPPDDAPTALLQRLSEQYGVDPTLVKAMAWLESGGKPLALSRSHALGLLQVTPGTFEYVQRALVRRPLDRNKIEDNAEAGVAYIGSLLRWAADESKALAAFIQGPGSIESDGIRPATDQAVRAVLALRAELQRPDRAPTGPTAVALAERVMAAARGVGGGMSSAGRVGIAGRDLVSGQRLSIAADQAFPAASVDKLAILVESYREAEAGTRPLTDVVKFDLQRMIASSDNDAANRLLDLYGLNNVNDAMSALGLARTRLSNHFGASHPSAASLNQSSPADMAHLLELLAADQLVSPSASREIRNLLYQAGDSSRLRRGLPSGARLAHKSGWFPGVTNDVGIVYQGQSAYVLAVFTEGISDGDAASETIAAIAHAVHATWGPKS